MESDAQAIYDKDIDARFQNKEIPNTVLASDGIDDETIRDLLKDNQWPDEVAFGWDFIDRRISARLVFVYEKNNAVESILSKFNASLSMTMSSEDKAFYNKMIKGAVEFTNNRAFAKHPKKEGEYAFPYILVKFNPKFKAPYTEPDTKENFRMIIPVRNQNDRFIIRPKTDQHGEALVDWAGTYSPFEKALEDQGCYKFQLARDMYQMRNTLAVHNDFLKYFATAEIDPRELYVEVKQKFLHFVDMPDEWAMLSALWVLGTHVFNNFPAYPYIYLLGPQDTGKTRWMKVACQMAHRGRLELNPTGPAIFREVDSTQSTLFIDEVDKIDFKAYPEIRAILNTGYESGFDVPRMNMDLKMMEYFKTYSPKCLGSNGPIDSVLASRMLRLPLQRTPNARLYVKRDPMKPDSLIEFNEIHKQILVWAIDQAPYLASYEHSAMETKWEPIFEELNAPPRLMQILTPILMMYDVLRLDEDFGDYSPAECANIKKVVRHLIEDSKMATLPDADLRSLAGLYHACFSPSPSAMRGRNGEAVLVNTENIRNSMGLETKEDQKFYDSRRVGMILNKYSIPKRKTNGVFVYLEDKTKTWTHEDQKECVMDLFKRFNIDPKELDNVTAQDSSAGSVEHLDTSRYKFGEE